MVTPGTNFSYTCPCTGPNVHVRLGSSNQVGENAISPSNPQAVIPANATVKLGDPTTVSVLASNDRNTSVECEADPPDTICNSVNKVCLLVVQGKGLVELNTDKQPLLLQAHQDLLQLPQ